MFFYEVIPSKAFRAGSDFLTYHSDLELSPGSIVTIPLGKSETTGIVFKKVKKEEINFKTKPISHLLYENPLPNHLLKSLLWLSDYYLTPLPTFSSLFLPNGVTKNRRKPKNPQKTTEEPKKLPLINLNPAQKMALEGLESSNKATKLLHGITGSGKTNIYLEMARKALLRNQSTILLVPEIALTSQLVKIFNETFGGHIILIHSRQTEAERHKIWEKILISTEPLIVIGPRSALFAPLNNLGLIIIDEAHESAYYQDNSPRYSALRLASFMAKTLKISCILGTATPLVSDYYLAKTNSSLIALKQKAKKTAIPPKISVLDFSSREDFSKNRYFSNALLENISENLKNNRQTLIFHNRRGSAPLTICEKCGWQALCPNCFLPLTLHSDSFSLICHTCGFSMKTPNSCPNCHFPNIIHKGFGTKLLESELKKLFPSAKIARFDADNKKHESLDALYEEVKSGNINILIGTQTVARGLDLPLLASVGIIQADAGLSLPDFSAEERTFHLLTQVIGRVGRGHLDSASVFVQTFQPDSEIIKFALNSDYESFYEYSLKKRKKQGFPPFSYLAKITITYKTEKTTLKNIRNLYKTLSENNPKKVLISQPIPSFHEHTNSGYSWQLILRSPSRLALLELLKAVPSSPSTRIILDPPSLL